MSYKDYAYPVIRGDTDRTLRRVKRLLQSESVFKSVKENRYYTPGWKKKAMRKAAKRKAIRASLSGRSTRRN